MSHVKLAAAGLVLGSVLVACNHDDTVGVDAAADAMSCDPTCLMQSWWLGRSSDCATVCMGNPGWAECMHSDCEVIEASRYSNGTRASLAPMLFSAEARSFYLIGSPGMQDYTVGGDCKLQIGSAAPETFACVGSMLQLPTATLDLATTQQATVLDGVTAPGRYTY
jgi:hypothetical protein